MIYFNANKEGRLNVRHLRGAMAESVSSVLPIAALVLLLSVTLAPMESGILVLFVFCFR